MTRPKTAAASGPREPSTRWQFALRLLPGAAFLAFFVFTVLLFFFGPWHYPIDQGRGRLITFLVAVHVAFALGCVWGARGAPAGVRWSASAGKIVLAAATVELFLLLPTSAFETGHWIPRPDLALTDLATVYSRSLVLRDQGHPYVNYVRILVAPLLAMAVPLGVFYWRGLDRITRIVFAASVIATIIRFVDMGANAGLGDWMAFFPWFVLAGHFSNVQRLDRRGWFAAVSIMAVSMVLFVGLFAATMIERRGSFVTARVLPGIGARLAPASRLPIPSTSRRKSPSAVTADANGLAAYFTQGYFAVYLSLQEPFVPGYGVGNSVFLQRQAARLLHAPGILLRPYPVRIQSRGWNAYGYWATIYPWLASDVTFPGVVVVMLFVGWLTSRVWVDALGGKNPFAVAFFGQMLFLLYYVPAHNKVMHSGEGVTAFWGLLVVWLVTRRSTPEVRDPAVVFVGAWVPDRSEFHGPAFSRAAQMFQQGLVRAWTAADLPPSAIYSIEPIPAFPRSRRVFSRVGRIGAEDGHTIRFLPFVNVPLLKPLTAGCSAACAIMAWAWTHRGRPRIVHCFNLTMPPGIFLWLAARLSGSRVFVALADINQPGVIVPDTWAWRLDFWLQRRLIRRFDGLAVQSSATTEDFAPGRRVCRIVGGILPERFVGVASRRTDGVASRFRVVLAGSLERYNGVEVALRAMSRLPDGIELIVAGTGSLVEAVNQSAAADPRIVYKGSLDFASLLQLYESADLLLNVRLTRAVDTRYFFPSKLMELLASGTPVLSTAFGEVRDEFGQFLYLLADETPEALADGIASLAALPEKERRARGLGARRFMFENMTWEAQGAKLARYVRQELPPDA